MSFRLFVYYCALGGAWAGFIGWLLGMILSSRGGEDYFPFVLRTSLIGMFLGFAIALGLSFLDAAFNLSLSQIGKVLVRVASAVVVGIFGGLFGSFLSGSLVFLTQKYPSISFFTPIAIVLGWMVVGMLVGASISLFEVFNSLTTRKDFAGSSRKFIKCAIGGAVGGLLGGVFVLAFESLAGYITSKDVRLLWTPTALGFMAIGASIGLLVGLAQIILKEAWIKVEAGFRPGREMLIAKEKTSIGRAEGSDIALFGDAGVEKTHANIVLDSGRYYLEDQQSPGGTFVNDSKVNGRAPLKAGDLIRVGKSVLRFNERTKRQE
jgi:hypothetical protein